MVVLVRRANVQISRFNAEQEGVGEELFFGPTIIVKNCVDQGTKKVYPARLLIPQSGQPKVWIATLLLLYPQHFALYVLIPQKSTNV